MSGHGDSDAFGVGAPTGSQEVNLRFAGQYFDAESDLHYNWNRYYNPATGRYVSSDPIGLDGGVNTYGYVEANPVMYVDPEGLLAEDVLWTGYVFKTELSAVADAIIKALNDFRSKSNEFGGIVYEKCDMFAYDYKFISGRTGHIFPHSAIVADGGKPVAGWHTHPTQLSQYIYLPRPESSIFSNDDIRWVRENNLRLWLGTPKGNIKVLRPEDLL